MLRSAKVPASGTYFKMLSFLSDTKTLLALGVVFVVVYLISLAIYRLYFHPLARFPGPKLAALSKWYEFYYDVYLQGQFVFQLEELHKRYGMCFRSLIFRSMYHSQTNIQLQT